MFRLSHRLTPRFRAGRWSVKYTRNLSYSQPCLAIKPFLLADIGEGIRECEVIQWFVEPEARVEQFDKLCEVQSDKASVEITSRFDGVVKKLHYQAGDMAIVGKPLVDIDVPGDDPAAEEPVEAVPEASAGLPSSEQRIEPVSSTAPSSNGVSVSSGRHRALTTPAVRRLTRELNVDISEVTGSGKDGRVMKEDVLRFAEDRRSRPAESLQNLALTREETVPLSNIQMQMFKTMSNSLSIPHFLYSDEVALDSLIRARGIINPSLSQDPDLSHLKLSYMPFIIKAVSMALKKYPLLNSQVDMSASDKPQLKMRPQHNIGIAMDTPAGLLVPIIKFVDQLSILEIAADLHRLQKAGAEGKLTPTDIRGGTITVSNIGNIGGTVVAPVIVPTEVAILGIGRARRVPVFGASGEVVPSTVVNFSWSADHRVVDGATMARFADMVRRSIEKPELMLARLG